MPNPGQANNGAGINIFSGPLGEKEPAYGATERLKVLSRLAPVGSPAAQNAPRRAQRSAQRGKKTAPAPAPLAPAPATVENMDSYQQQLTAFWAQVAADPNASDLVRKYAGEVAG